MTAATLDAHNAPLTLHTISMGSPLFGEVKVRVLMAGICGAQLQEIAGHKAENMPLPRCLGHEGCGEVVEIGDGVTTVKEGDRVCLHWRKGAGMDVPHGTIYHHFDYVRITDVPAGPIHTFCSEAILSENRITKVDYDTPPELVSLLGCALSTALACIENDAKLRIGESFGISGMGGVGRSLLHAGTAIGALYEATDKVDCIFDTTGNPEQIEACFARLNPGGRLILIGQPAPNHAIRIPNARHMFDGSGMSIIASQGGQFVPQRDIPRYVKLWRAGLLQWEPIVSHAYPLAEVNAALDMLRTGTAGRILLDCNEDPDAWRNSKGGAGNYRFKPYDSR